jgi:DNA-binding transcriptional regulator YiaG
MSAKQTPESFWARVKKSKGCWEWQGALNSTGYGSVAWGGHVYTAHRVAAWLSGLVKHPSRPTHASELTHVLHKCDNRKCCNPEHFFLGAYKDNQLDAYKKKRRVQPRGGAHVNAKLTKKQATEIRRVYKVYGLSQQTLANRYGVSQAAISLIIRKKTYT